VLEDRKLTGPEEEKQVKELLLKLYVNTANTSLHLNRPYVCMHYCKKALDIDPRSVKALYHYGKAKIDVGDYDDAVKYLLKARAIKPNNTDIGNELQRLNRRIGEDEIVSREMERRMAGIFRSDRSGNGTAAAAGSGSGDSNASAPAATSDK
jgi:FK506-binding protein 6